MPPDDLTKQPPQAHPNYAAFNLARALRTNEGHADEATRGRARIKADKWLAVLEGLRSGDLMVGSRQPILAAPVWATPEVVSGGFVTGQLLAGGPWRPHENALANRIGEDGAHDDRTRLNGWFLSGAGFEELLERLTSGHYEIDVPEEAALLVVAWLAQNGAKDDALDLLEAIAPHFAQLRFYPKPGDQLQPTGARIFLETVGTVLSRLQSIRADPKILAESEAIHVWRPLYDQMIALFLETVSGEAPTIQPDAAGRWASPETRRFYVVGGQPCRHYATDWPERAQTLVDATEQALATHKLCRKPNDASESFPRLLGYLRKCINDRASLTGREVGMIRLILARHVASRGLPASPQHQAAKERQLSQVAGPMHHQIARIVAQRLAALPPERGSDDTTPLVQPTTTTESEKTGLASGTHVPTSIVQKVDRCLCDTADVLIRKGIVTSGETLARVIPQFTSALRAPGFRDSQLGALYAATYRAFRRRRSLLLLNLEKQVRINELPWVAAIERHRRKDLTSRELARQTLKDVAALTLRAFPQSILPNKLLQEFRALAKDAMLELPFVEELAADIFMDRFSPKFTQAAKQAAAFVEGSLYARYYGLDCAAVQRMPDDQSESRRWSWFNQDTPKYPFAALCIERADAKSDKRWDVARNGTIIEQAQILTTHNLAIIFGSLGLEEELKKHLRGMAEQCFRWICRRQQAKSTNKHAQLITLKQTAYAWRQMVFYVSRLSPQEAGEFINWAEDHLAEQANDFRVRFKPALCGLKLAHEGTTLDNRPEARRFLGWTQKRHWLLGEEPPKADR